MDSNKTFKMQLIFKEIQPDHLNDLTTFFKENNLPKITRVFNPFPLNAETAYSIACSPHQDIFWGAFLEKRMVGLSMLRGWDEGFAIPSFGILVDYRYQGQGVGSKMLDLMIQKAKQRKCDKIRLTVYLSNSQGIKWFYSKGFIEHSRKQINVSGAVDVKIIAYKDL